MGLMHTPWTPAATAPQMPTPGEVVMAAQSVSVTIDSHEILRDVSLEVRAGEVLALIGPNGAGKSTLLSAMTGDLPTTTGRVLLDGEPLEHWTHTERAMRRAVLLQKVDISFPFTVREVVEMGRAPWAGTPQEDDSDAIVDSCLRMTQTDTLSERTYTSLSGGERGRAALARVLTQSCPVLLLDEPTAAMDIRHQELVLQLARRYAQSGCAVVIVVHALDVAAAYADRIALLAGGRMNCVGTPEQVLTAERLSEVYEYPVDVITHPVTGAPIVIPVRTLATSKEDN